MKPPANVLAHSATRPFEPDRSAGGLRVYRPCPLTEATPLRPGTRASTPLTGPTP